MAKRTMTTFLSKKLVSIPSVEDIKWMGVTDQTRLRADIEAYNGSPIMGWDDGPDTLERKAHLLHDALHAVKNRQTLPPEAGVKTAPKKKTQPEPPLTDIGHVQSQLQLAEKRVVELEELLTAERKQSEISAEAITKLEGINDRAIEGRKKAEAESEDRRLKLSVLTITLDDTKDAKSQLQQSYTELCQKHDALEKQLESAKKEIADYAYAVKAQEKRHDETLNRLEQEMRFKADIKNELVREQATTVKLRHDNEALHGVLNAIKTTHVMFIQDMINREKEKQ